jgi:flagellar biosynthesis protein FliR
LEKLLKYFSYLLSAVFFVGGLLVILDVFNLSNVPKEMRVALGIVLMLWAIYRFVITLTKSKQYEEEE